ncbi:MAG: hypothetical protein DRO11_03435 [Methanobacteriota archaeon]|nr:MAG: hypothetical protein DRO11_03435 [Euryarchaeota archaeon]
MYCTEEREGVAICVYCGACICEEHGNLCETCLRSVCNPDTTGVDTCWAKHDCRVSILEAPLDEETGKVFRLISQVGARHNNVAPLSIVGITAGNRGIDLKTVERSVEKLKELGYVVEEPRGYLRIRGL